MNKQSKKHVALAEYAALMGRVAESRARDENGPLRSPCFGRLVVRLGASERVEAASRRSSGGRVVVQSRCRQRCKRQGGRAGAHGVGV